MHVVRLSPGHCSIPRVKPLSFPIRTKTEIIKKEAEGVKIWHIRNISLA